MDPRTESGAFIDSRLAATDTDSLRFSLSQEDITSRNERISIVRCALEAWLGVWSTTLVGIQTTNEMDQGNLKTIVWGNIKVSDMHEHVIVIVNQHTGMTIHSTEVRFGPRKKNSDHFKMIPYYNSFLELLPEWLRPCMLIRMKHDPPF